MLSSGVGRYMTFPPSPSPSAPHLSGLRSAASTSLAEQDKYLTELLGERHKLSPFMAVLPNCYRLLNQATCRGRYFAQSCKLLQPFTDTIADTLIRGKIPAKRFSRQALHFLWPIPPMSVDSVLVEEALSLSHYDRNWTSHF